MSKKRKLKKNSVVLLLFYCFIVFSSFYSYSQEKYIIPIEIIDYRIYLKGTINGTACNFLFDTGDYGIVLDNRFVEANNIEIPEYRKKKEYEISFNGFSKKTLSVRTQDCNIIGGNFDQGIIGVNFFEDFIVEIDYKNQKLKLFESNYLIDSSYSLLPTEQLKGLFLFGSFICELTIQSDNNTNVSGNFLFDTGSGRNITILNHFPIKIDSESAFRKGINSSHHGNNLSKYFSANVLFNGRTYQKLIVDYILDKNEEVSKVIDGVIGGQFLQNFNILIDYKNANIYIKQNVNLTDFITNLVTDGIIYRDRRKDLGGLLVSAIITHPVLEENMCLNDLIIKINDISVKELDYKFMRDLQSVNDNTINYTIKRKRRIKEISTTVKEIF